VVTRVSGSGNRKVAVRVLLSKKFGGCRATQTLSEFVLVFSALSFCSSERGKIDKRKKR
jgi:hypothetical protein